MGTTIDHGPVQGEIGASVSGSSVPVARADTWLTETQSAFIDAYIRLGGKGEQAAIEAGYGGGAANMATRNLAKPKIQAEIAKRLKLQTGSALATAVGALLEVIETGEDERARVQAALGLMDRYGMSPPKGPAVAVQVNNISGQDASAVLQMVAERASKRLASS